MVYIWLAYIAFLVIVIVMKASFINFLFLILILIPTTLHLWNETVAERKGFKYTREAWIINVLYCGIVVLSLYLFQFGSMFIIKRFTSIYYLPQMAVKNSAFFGFEQFSDGNRWLSFLPYFALLFLSVVASRHVHNVQEEESNDDFLLRIPVNSHSSDSKFFLNKMYFT